MNRRGTYFGRMITGGNPEVHDGNQLEFILSSYTDSGLRRRSALQAATFDPRKDHTLAARVSFPCMQQVAFTRIKVGGGHALSLSAFYATQTLIERAYGNYLGLCHLGAFVSHELGLPLARVTCVASLARRDAPLGSLRDLLGKLPRDLVS